MRIALLIAMLALSGCETAFEIGESLNRATSNIAADPARYVWSKDPGAGQPAPASAPVATATPAQQVPSQ